MKTDHRLLFLLIVLSTLVLTACSTQTNAVEPTAMTTPSAPAIKYDAEFTLKTAAGNGKLSYIGVGGDIDGIVNPDLTVQPGAVVHIILINGDGMQHDLYLPDFKAKTAYVSKIGEKAEIVFEAGSAQPDTYVYYCTVPGHRQAGQEGKLIVVAR